MHCIYNVYCCDVTIYSYIYYRYIVTLYCLHLSQQDCYLDVNSFDNIVILSYAIHTCMHAHPLHKTDKPHILSMYISSKRYYSRSEGAIDFKRKLNSSLTKTSLKYTMTGFLIYTLTCVQMSFRYFSPIYNIESDFK